MQVKKILTLSLFSLLTPAFHAGAQDMDYSRKVIKTLSSPAFKGRGYVAKGDQIASAFIAKEFEKSGLIPLNKGSYFQDFELSVNTFPGKVAVKLNNTKLKTAADYLVDATSPAIHGKFNVIPVNRAGINTPEKFEDLIRQAATSFILLDNRDAGKESTAEQRTISAHVRALRSSEKLHFKGLVIFTTEKLTWTTLTYQNPRPVIQVNKQGLDPGSIQTITIDLDSKLRPDYQTRNVAGMIKGYSGSDSTLVITAHFDHLGMLGRKVYFPGANDNASGTTFMLNMVRYYAQHQPKYNTVFIAFSGEEIGLLGSRAFVKNPLIDLKKIRFLVNFDLAGTGEEGIKVVNGTIFRNKFDQLSQLNTKYQLVPKVEIRDEACKSDHCPFYQQGVPSFFIYTLGGIQAYHDIYDKAETLPLTAFKNYFQLMIKFFDTF
ncbi:M28 family metallopeptidase [Pedobacter heparinus]|uniref:M28 family metallopeptidase n=1 Tax=Pedobacter heparinus TaxID=984 RepID=UPI00292D2C43|nr:M28 family peptidase [Pedobacter heparinus]